MAESVIFKKNEATDNKKMKKETVVKRKKTLRSIKSSNPTHTENVIPPLDDTIEPLFKISKIVGNYSTDNEINIDKSISIPMPLQFCNKIEVEEDCIKNIGHSPKSSKIRKEFVKSELESKSYENISAFGNIKDSSGDTHMPLQFCNNIKVEEDCIKNVDHSPKSRKEFVKSELESKSYESISEFGNIKESSGDTHESVGVAGITGKSNSTDDVITTSNKLIISSKPIINKLPTEHAVNKISPEPEVIKLFDPVKTEAQSFVNLIKTTTNGTEQLLKSINNLDKNTDNLSNTKNKPLESVSKSQAVLNAPIEVILIENEKLVACKGLLNDPAKPVMDENEKHVTYRDTYDFEIDYVLETGEELFRSSTDPVDKKLECDFRSYWCKPPVVFEEIPAEKMLHDSIMKWRYGQNTPRPRDPPVSYKCYICMKAWWHLSEFRDHIRTHNEHNLKVDLEKNSHECSIISYLGKKPQQEDIYIEGKCWKCRYGFEEHSLEKRHYGSLYTCYKCNEKFHTCTDKRHHEERCAKGCSYRMLAFLYECEQCAANFDNKEDLYDHQIHRHCVRSDIPAVTYAKKCYVCKVLYSCYNYHTCPKKLETAKCKYCCKNFCNRFLVEVHMNLSKSNVKCNFCERVLMKECLMMEHLIMEHSVNFMLVYRCRICPKPVLMRTPLAIARHKKKCHSKVRCDFIMLVPVPKKCLSDLDVSEDSSLDECKQTEDIKIITNTVNKQEVIEIIDSDEDDERDGTNNIKMEIFEAEENKLHIDSIDNEENAMISINYNNVDNEQAQNTDNFNIANKLTYNNDIKVNIETEIFEAEENKLQIDEDITNPIDNDVSAMASINYDNVNNEQTQNRDNFNIANKLTYNNDIKVQQEIVDNENQKELHIDIKQVQEECDPKLNSEDLKIMKEVNRYENCLSKVFQASKFANASSILDDNVGVTDNAETPNAAYVSLDNVGVTDSAETANGDAAYTSLDNVGVTDSTETANGDAAYASLDNVGVTDSTETANVHGAYTSLDPVMLQTVLKNLQSEDYKSPKTAAAHGEHAVVYPCCVCFKKISRHSDSKRHLIEHLVKDAYVAKLNNGKAYFRCQICDSEHAKIDKYKVHMREHASLPIYRCEVCNKKFINRTPFARHQKVHDQKARTCDICNAVFARQELLKKHMITVHSTSDSLKCKWCQEIFYEKSVFKKHVKMEHYRTRHQPKCHVCGISFERLKDQWQHMWEEHKQTEIAAKCPLCNATYKSYADAKIHMSAVHKKVL